MAFYGISVLWLEVQPSSALTDGASFLIVCQISLRYGQLQVS